MQDETFTVSDQIDQQDYQFLEDQLFAYNMAATGYRDGRDVALFVRDAQGAILAGLFGWTWGGMLKIQYLWVREDCRGKDYGTRLLQAAEAEGRARGCRQVALDTHSFQAPLFYQKLGYEVYGILEDDPLGYKTYHLKKSLMVG
jgi:GNAT superfamily N-acetyltransferase